MPRGRRGAVDMRHHEGKGHRARRRRCIAIVHQVVDEAGLTQKLGFAVLHPSIVHDQDDRARLLADPLRRHPLVLRRRHEPETRQVNQDDALLEKRAVPTNFEVLDDRGQEACKRARGAPLRKDRERFGRGSNLVMDPRAVAAQHRGP